MQIWTVLFKKAEIQEYGSDVGHLYDRKLCWQWNAKDDLEFSLALTNIDD